jgi:hypothetical protein
MHYYERNGRRWFIKHYSDNNTLIEISSATISYTSENETPLLITPLVQFHFAYYDDNLPHIIENIKRFYVKAKSCEMQTLSIHYRYGYCGQLHNVVVDIKTNKYVHNNSLVKFNSINFDEFHET